nr:basic salivary proline-rich protein 4-like [Penaeus vannamei]
MIGDAICAPKASASDRQPSSTRSTICTSSHDPAHAGSSGSNKAPSSQSTPGLALAELPPPPPGRQPRIPRPRKLTTERPEALPTPTPQEDRDSSGFSSAPTRPPKSSNTYLGEKKYTIRLIPTTGVEPEKRFQDCQRFPAVSKESQKPPRVHKGFQRVPKASEGSQGFPKGPKSLRGFTRVGPKGGSQGFPKGPKSLRGFTRVSKGSQKPPRVHKGFQRVPKGPKESKRPQESPRIPRAAPEVASRVPRGLVSELGGPRPPRLSPPAEALSSAALTPPRPTRGRHIRPHTYDALGPSGLTRPRMA